MHLGHEEEYEFNFAQAVPSACFSIRTHRVTSINPKKEKRRYSSPNVNISIVPILETLYWVFISVLYHQAKRTLVRRCF